MGKVSMTDYNWLVLFIVMSSTAMIGAGFDNDIPLFMSILLVIAILINTLISKNDFKINKIGISFGLYVVWAAISIIWSVTPIRTVIETMHLILYLMVYLFVQFINQAGKDKLIRVMLIVASVITLIGFFEYLFMTGNRIQSTLTNANPFAIFMVMFFLMTLSISIRQKSILMYALSGLFATAILLSGSRAAIISLIASIVLVFLQIPKNKLMKAIVHTVIVLIIALALSQFMSYISNFTFDKLGFGQSILDQLIRKDTLISESVNGRLEFWRVAWSLFTNRPLLGYGQGSYYSAYHIEYGMNQWYSRFTHNNFLQILSETGIIGVLLFLLFIFNIVKSVIHQYKSIDKPIWFWGMTAGATAFMIHTCVDFSWNFPAVTVLFISFVSMTNLNEVDDYYENSSINKNNNIRRVVYIPLLSLVLLLNVWHFTSMQLLRSALEREQTESVSSALELTQLANSIYQVGSYGWKYESKLHYLLYQENNNPMELRYAIESANKAVMLEPYNYTMKIELANLYKQTGDYDTAEKYLIDANKYSAYYLNALIELSSLYLEQGNKIDAIKSLLESSDKSPLSISMASSELEKELLVDTTARIYLTLANLYNEIGDNELAQEQIEHLEKLAFEYESVQKYLVQPD